jgi:nucleotide-binding universal stress UspA family protein
MIRKLGLALAFSPTCTALLAETSRLMQINQAKLVLIHVGTKDTEKEALLDALCRQTKIPTEQTKIVWETGKTAKTIIKICKKERVDLLIAGALRQENFLNYYIGSVARKILRKAHCSLLILTEPSLKARNLKQIIIEVEDSPIKNKIIRYGLQFARIGKTKTIHFIRELNLYGLSLSVMSAYSMNELSEQKKNLIHLEAQNIEKSLKNHDLDGFHTNIKILSGKSGYEIRNFARKIKADLLVLGAPNSNLQFIDRLFMSNLEYIIKDIPCNLLIIKKG